MNKELAGLSDEELMQRIKSVFFFPLDLERLHSYSKKGLLKWRVLMKLFSFMR